MQSIRCPFFSIAPPTPWQDTSVTIVGFRFSGKVRVTEILTIILVQFRVQKITQMNLEAKHRKEVARWWKITEWIASTIKVNPIQNEVCPGFWIQCKNNRAAGGINWKTRAPA